jgi:Na+-driven multidrug efflux pump
MDGVKFGMLYTVIIMAIGTIVLEIFAEPIATAFGLSDMARDFCISAMRVISISFVFAGMNVAFQGIFQALDSGVASLVISVCRQFLFVLPVASAFSKVAIKDPDKMWLVWSTFIIAEVVSAAIATFFMSRIYKNKIKVLGGKQ